MSKTSSLFVGWSQYPLGSLHAILCKLTAIVRLFVELIFMKNATFFFVCVNVVGVDLGYTKAVFQYMRFVYSIFIFYFMFLNFHLRFC